jgi:cellulose synthase/poly-beta-1,6-N-acetylglucosamine synthase-like glycosyltransferase
LVYLLGSILIFVFCIWNLYSIPALAIGFRNLVKRRRSSVASVKCDSKLPFVSVIVPAKNEERVIGRLLRSLLKINYPSSLMEILVVDDNSTDRTYEICQKFVDGNPGRIRVFRRSKCSTKASALNFGLGFAKGDLVATFDADSLPEFNVLLNVVKYFKDPKVAGVQGTIFCSNSDENMLTRFLSLERSIQYQVYQNGKDCLGLFVSLNGTCQFIRRSVLMGLGGWNETSLAEDMELSLRLAERDYKVRYAVDVKTHEESPNDISGLMRQRTRWFRGNIENMITFGRLLKKPASWVRLDAEIQLFGTFIAVLCVFNYFMAGWTFTLSVDQFLVGIMYVTSVFTFVILALVGVSLVAVSKPLKLSNLLWLPFIYVYWALQSFIALNAVFLIIFKRPTKWSKTKRSGLVTSSDAKKIAFHVS